MMPSAKIVICDRFLPGEHVVQAEHRVLRLIDQRRQRLGVDARGRDVAADTIDREQPEREQHTLPEVGNREDVLEAFHNALTYARTSALPPAAAIFSAALPLNLCARTVNAFEISPRASTLIRPARPIEPVLAENLRRDFRARLEPLAERIEVDDLEFLAERIVEPALRHAAVQRHLAAFEPALVLEARTRLRALVAASGLHALARPLAAADALLRVRRTLRGTEITEIHVVSSNC